MELSVKLSEVQQAFNGLRTEFKQSESERAHLESQLAEAAGIRSESETRLKEAAERYARAEESIASMREELITAATIRDDLETRLKNTAKLSDTPSAHSELETHLQKAVQERTELEAEVKKLQADLQAARAQVASSTANTSEEAAGMQSHTVVSSVFSEKLDGEVARVQNLLVEAIKLIDDPATALSTVMRKNAEKAELESYLRGIRFATGQDESSSSIQSPMKNVAG
jgi:chromosome segregation ATPase